MLYQGVLIEIVSCERLDAAFKPYTFSGSFDSAPVGIVREKLSARSAQDDKCQTVSSRR
jgi:hypothetical protein